MAGGGKVSCYKTVKRLGNRDDDSFAAGREFRLMPPLRHSISFSRSAIMASPPPQATPRRLSADQALRELLEGNQRFVAGKRLTPRARPEDFRTLAHGQYPEAVIVSCADSRVSPEILFDVGVGDVFVVRVAGNVVGGAGVTVKGSIEYAVAELNVPPFPSTLAMDRSVVP